MKAQKNNNLLRNQKGFTLIEIIAVLIILGILAAIAIPKYMSLQDDAHNNAVLGAVAAGTGTLTQTYASALLKAQGGAVTCLAGVCTGTAPGGAAVSVGATTSVVGEFTVTFAGAGTATTVTVTAGPNWFVAGAPYNAAPYMKTVALY